jgi:hypothetical protein
VVEDAEDEETRTGRRAGARSRSAFVARLERTTRARERESLDVEIDVTRLHFFDTETGARIGQTA